MTIENSGEYILVEQTVAERLRVNPPQKQYKIGEVSLYSGLSRQTVHNYTIMGLIEETGWTDGGHRLYPEEVFCKLARIDQLKQSCTLREIRKIMESEAKIELRQGAVSHF